MKEVAGGGRTCCLSATTWPRSARYVIGAFAAQGRQVAIGPTDEVIQTYIQSTADTHAQDAAGLWRYTNASRFGPFAGDYSRRPDGK